MDDHQNLGRRVNSLETRMAEVVTALGGFKGTLEEIKASITNARPPFWMIIPTLLTFASMLAGGIFFFVSVRSELAQLHTVDTLRTAEIERLRAQVYQNEERFLSEVTKERDFLRQKLGTPRAPES